MEKNKKKFFSRLFRLLFNNFDNMLNVLSDWFQKKTISFVHTHSHRCMLTFLNVRSESNVPYKRECLYV